MKTYNIKETAARIGDLRVNSGYTQETAADLIGVERSYLSRIENVVKGCSVDLFIRIAEIYHVSLDYLLYGETPNSTEARVTLNSVISQLTALRDQL